MDRNNPLIAAAKRELDAIYLETGGVFDPLNNPNRSPEYLTAMRIFRVLLDADAAVRGERYKVRTGRRHLTAVKINT